MIVAAVAGTKNMGRVWSVITVPIVVTPVFGPALGGVLLDQLGWRWIFLVNLPLCALAFVMGLRILPHTARAPAGRLDVRGIVLLVGGLPLFMYGLVATGRSPVGLVAGTMAGGAVLLALFGVHARRSRAPLLDVRLFANRAFASSSLVSLAAGAALSGAMLLMPLYFQEIRGADATAAGVMLAPQAVGMALVTPFLGRLTARFGGGSLVAVGLVVTIGGTLPLAFLDESTPYSLIEPALLVRGIGFGLVLLPAMIAAFATLRPDQLSDGTPQVSVVQRVGGSVGTAVFAVLLAHYLRGVTGSGERSAHVLAGAYATAYWWAVGLTAAAFGPAWLLIRAERAQRSEERLGRSA